MRTSAGIVGVVGAGTVGVATATVLASWGTHALLVENDPARFELLRKHRTPFFDPNLEVLLGDVARQGTLRFSRTIDDLVDADIVIVCVGTPPTTSGALDLSALERVVDRLAEVSPSGTVVVIKSTVPPGTAERLAAVVSRTRPDLTLVSCPEFLREANCLDDVRRPARIVIGGPERAACEKVAALFAPANSPIILTSATSAELIKYGANAFLATKISFVNELSHFCDLVGADVTVVAAGIGADPRIGTSCFSAGLGFGGSCFPKDVRALEDLGASRGYRSLLLQACSEINAQQKERIITKIRAALGGTLRESRIAVLGLAFKPGTDDLRQAPSLDVINKLVLEGATVTATDPIAAPTGDEFPRGAKLVRDVYQCVQGADAILLATEWPDYRSLDWTRVRSLLRRNVVVDGRNFLDGTHLVELGFVYQGVGTPTRPPTAPSPDGVATEGPA
jgi:UDPglucose 6-dehydrogenase